jgi:hypothetical protein
LQPVLLTPFTTGLTGFNGGNTMQKIIVQVSHGENFTAAGLMKRYANQNGVAFQRSRWGDAELVIGGKAYRYHHWSITANNKNDLVTLYLERAN